LTVEAFRAGDSQVGLEEPEVGQGALDLPGQRVRVDITGGDDHDVRSTVGLAHLVVDEVLQSCYDRPTFTGFVAHYLGGLATILGQYAEAEIYFAAAASSAARMGATWAAACTQLAWGRLLVARSASGDRERAQTMLTEAQILADAHGYATVARRARAALAAAGSPRY
jgi:hypothetical protein